MVGQEQLESSPLCQHSDNETETKRECSVVIPDDWQLTSQQQAFIELFALSLIHISEPTRPY